MTILIYVALLLQSDPPKASAIPAAEKVLLEKIEASGRNPELSRDEPVIAPGPPPLLSFRYYEGKVRHRFGNSDLMMDDAGH